MIGLGYYHCYNYCNNSTRDNINNYIIYNNYYRDLIVTRVYRPPLLVSVCAPAMPYCLIHHKLMGRALAACAPLYTHGLSPHHMHACLFARSVHPVILKVQPGPGTVRIEWTVSRREEEEGSIVCKLHGLLLTSLQLMSHLRSVTGYLVMYKSSCNAKYHTKIVGNVNATTIEGLHSHSNYTLRMTVVCNSTSSNTFTPLHSFTTPDQSKAALAPPVAWGLYDHPTPPLPRCDGGSRQCVSSCPQCVHSGNEVGRTGPLRLER